MFLPHSAEDTPIPAIEDAFKDLTERDDIAILLINQYVRLKGQKSAKWMWKGMHRVYLLTLHVLDVSPCFLNTRLRIRFDR